MSRRFRALALALVAALGFTLLVASPATADPVVILQHDDAHLSITVARNADTVNFSVTNVGVQVEKLGLGAYLSNTGEIDLLWQGGPFPDQFQLDLAPGDHSEISAPFLPGVQAFIYRERDTTPELVDTFMTDGDWVQLVLAGTPEDPQIRLGPDISVQNQTVVPGEAVFIDAAEVPTLGALDVLISSDSSLNIVGDQWVLTPGPSARSIGDASVSYGVPEDGYRNGFTLVADIPLDTPPGEYQIILVGDQAGVIPSYSMTPVTVVAGSAQPGTAGTASITGRARLHDTLTAVTTGWDPAATLVYHWYADGEPIVRGTQPTLVLDYYENGKVVTVEVEAWRGGYSRAAALSAPTARVSHEMFTETSPPTISGDFVVGSKLTAVAPPVWVPSTGFTYTWYVDYQATGDTGTSYKIKPADVGKSVAVLASSKRIGFHDSSYFSLWSAPVAPGILTPPANVDRPKITGVPRVGNPLTLRTGGWKPSPNYSVQWTLDGVPVPGATGLTFTVPGQVGAIPTLGGQIGATLVVSSPGYQDATATLAATGLVSEGAFSPKGTPAILGVLAVGETLTADPGIWDAAATLSYQWEIVNVGVVSSDPTFVIPAAAQNRMIRLTVTASAPGYVEVVRSAVTATKVP